MTAVVLVVVYMAAVEHGMVVDVHGSGCTWYGGECTWQWMYMVWWWMYMTADVHVMVVDVHGSGCTWYGGGYTWQRMYRVGSLGSVDVHRATTKVKNKSLINYSLPGERTLSALT